MIVKNLYLVTGIKEYPAFVGDSTSECIKMLVPAASNDKEQVKKIVQKEYSKFIDKVTDIKLLYEVMEGLGYDENGVWRISDGIDGDNVYVI